MNLQQNTELIDKIIVGRIEPLIYAFETSDVKAGMKVGETHRELGERIDEWRRFYADVTLRYLRSARIDKETIFRDLSVHQFLEQDKNKERLMRSDFPDGVHFSREFFKEVATTDLDEAIDDIHRSARENDGKYTFYSTTRLKKVHKFKRGAALKPRRMQREVIRRYKAAVATGRKNLLMYAVMRFGKSYTSMCCAKESNARSVLIVSAKKDVSAEWQKTVESIGDFENYVFITKSKLKEGGSAIADLLSSGKRVVLFLTLQDLQGSIIKNAHKEVCSIIWDLLIVDETHFGARAEQYGRILRANQKQELRQQIKDVDTLDALEEGVKQLQRKITLHLSGTPYRVLMDGEFAAEDVIAYIQFSDIMDAKNAWRKKNIIDQRLIGQTPCAEWDNPYFGFPQMVRFAFQPNETSLKRIKELEVSGATCSFSEIFRPKSITKDSNEDFKRFLHEDVILDFLQAIDGSKQDCNILGFLDNDRIKNGSLCRHIVVVLPYCASCDALEYLIKTNTDVFLNLQKYEILNISGLNGYKTYPNTEAIKARITQCEKEGKKTMTLTVNRMLTGVTVPEWDTMLFLKATSSPEEYDQAIFRLQNPFVKKYLSADNGLIKLDMKPQTILVDFDPTRVFVLQEKRSRLYNANSPKKGNYFVKSRIAKELSISPIIIFDHNALREVTASDIMDKVIEYERSRNVRDEAADLPVDINLLNDKIIRDVIEQLPTINRKEGIFFNPYERKDKNGKSDNDSDIKPQIRDNDYNHNNGDGETASCIELNAETNEQTPKKDLASRLKSLYAYILYYAFLTESRVATLQDIINSCDKTSANRRLIGNLKLNKELLKQIQEHCNGQILIEIDYKIERFNKLLRNDSDQQLGKMELVLTKFCRLSPAEVATPSHVADKMVSYLPDDVFSRGPVLDLASKHGEFTVALLKRFGHGVASKIYSVCTSPMAYEFTRKVYELLRLPTKNVFADFTSFDLLQPVNETAMTQLESMNFGAIIGNPPYQENKEGTSDKPIYNHFIDMAARLSSYSLLITPARFLFNVGKTPKQWNKTILNSTHYKVMWYNPNASQVFESEDIKGGVAVTLYDRESDFAPIVHYTHYPELSSLLEKVCAKHSSGWMDAICYLQAKFNLDALYEYNPVLQSKVGSNGKEKRLTSSIFELSEIFTTIPEEGKYRIIGVHNGKRTYRYISQRFIAPSPNMLTWKVLLPKVNGTGALGEELSSPIIGEPGTGFTQSFISFGAFDTKDEAEACLKYLKTRFVRALLGVLKVTQDNNRNTWKYVPQQDFCSNLEIDWTKGVDEIDACLFRKYKLSKQEINFLKEQIKPMQ